MSNIAHYGVRLENGRLVSPNTPTGDIPYFTHVDLRGAIASGTDGRMWIELDGNDVSVTLRTLCYLFQRTTNGEYHGRVYYRFNPDKNPNTLGVVNLIFEDDVEQHLEPEHQSYMKIDDFEIGGVYIAGVNNIIYVVDIDQSKNELTYLTTHYPDASLRRKLVCQKNTLNKEIAFGVSSGYELVRTLPKKGIKVTKVKT